MSTEYEWKIKGIWKADAQSVGEELESLEKITPEAVLEKAKEPSSVMHNLFEWDDSIAATKYRLSQARQIIQQIVIRSAPDNLEPTKVRAFVSSCKNDSVYNPIIHVVTNITDYQVILAQAKEELQAFKNKYKNLVEFKELFDMIDSIT